MAASICHTALLLLSALPPAPKPLLSVAIEETPQLSANYFAGVCVLLPAACQVSVRVYSDAPLTLGDAWQRSGGMLIEPPAEPAAAAGPPPNGQGAKAQGSEPNNPRQYILLSPQLAGCFDWQLGDAAVRVLVLPPAQRKGYEQRLDGRWETYPSPARARSARVREHAACYAPPPLLLSLAEYGDLELAPGLRAADFIVKNRAGKMPAASLAVSPALVNKLHLARMLLAAAGTEPTTLRIVSGFRPPSYNRRIEAAALYSRHMYGDAADVIMDADGDGRMDDVTGDGKVTLEDGVWLAEFFRGAEAAGGAPGGIGVYEYPETSERGSHVHVDARGYVTRWGVSFLGRRPAAFRWWPPEEFEEEAD